MRPRCARCAPTQMHPLTHTRPSMPCTTHAHSHPSTRTYSPMCTHPRTTHTYPLSSAHPPTHIVQHREDEVPALAQQFDVTGLSDEAIDRCVAVLRKTEQANEGLGTWRDHVTSLQTTAASMRLFIVSFHWPIHLPKRSTVIQACDDGLVRDTGGVTWAL